MSDYYLLHTLLALKKETSLTAAAQSMGSSKSTFSRRLSVLEEQLDCRLTEQKNGRLQLTFAGEHYAEYAKKILDLAEEAKKSMDYLKTSIKGRIRIGLCNELTQGWCTEILNDYLALHPHIELEIHTFDTEKKHTHHYPLLDCDMCISCSPTPPASHNGRYFAQWERAIYQSTTLPTHPKITKLEQFESLSWITLTGQPSALEVQRDECTQQSVPLKSRYQASSLVMQADAITKGYGVGVLPRWLAECRKHGLKGKLKEVPSEWKAQPTFLYIHAPTPLPIRSQNLIDFLYQKRPIRWS